jgi:hypothetical protein
MATPHSGQPGIAVDSRGGAVIDPTANVIALNEAAVKRQDDLREAEGRRINQALTHTEQMAQLREHHAWELRESEAKRLDANRQVDVLAVQTLATSTRTLAENIATQTANTVKGLEDRLSALEKSSYTGVGKGEGSDAVKAANRATLGSVVAVIGMLAVLVFNLLRAGKP